MAYSPEFVTGLKIICLWMGLLHSGLLHQLWITKMFHSQFQGVIFSVEVSFPICPQPWSKLNKKVANIKVVSIETAFLNISSCLVQQTTIKLSIFERHSNNLVTKVPRATLMVIFISFQERHRFSYINQRYDFFICEHCIEG